MITIEQAVEMGISNEEIEAVCLNCKWAVDNIEGVVRGVGRWRDHEVMLGEISNHVVVNSRQSYLEFKRQLYQRAIDMMQ